jgi:hypothetical protein
LLADTGTFDAKNAFESQQQAAREPHVKKTCNINRNSLRTHQLFL